VLDHRAFFASLSFPNNWSNFHAQALWGTLFGNLSLSHSSQLIGYHISIYLLISTCVDLRHVAGFRHLLAPSWLHAETTLVPWPGIILKHHLSL